MRNSQIAASEWAFRHWLIKSSEEDGVKIDADR